MKVAEIKVIVQMMTDNDLTEFKIEAEEMHLCIKRGSERTIVTVPQAIAAAAPIAQAVVGTDAPEVDEDPKETIDSPIVGTFYRASSPESDSFVEIGTKVTPESVVCIIEAMKVMNEIKAEKSGTIKEILIDNAQAVEFGQPLFIIE